MFTRLSPSLRRSSGIPLPLLDLDDPDYNQNTFLDSTQIHTIISRNGYRCQPLNHNQFAVSIAAAALPPLRVELTRMLTLLALGTVPESWFWLSQLQVSIPTSVDYRTRLC